MKTGDPRPWSSLAWGPKANKLHQLLATWQEVNPIGISSRCADKLVEWWCQVAGLSKSPLSPAACPYMCPAPSPPPPVLLSSALAQVDIGWDIPFSLDMWTKRWGARTSMRVSGWLECTLLWATTHGTSHLAAERLPGLCITMLCSPVGVKFLLPRGSRLIGWGAILSECCV